MSNRTMRGVLSSALYFEERRRTFSRGKKIISSLLGLILLWVFFGDPPLRAQTPGYSDRPGVRGESGPGGREETEKAWFAHRQFLEKGDWDKSREELEKIYQWKLDRGIRNHYPSSLALVRESQQAAAKEGSAAPGLLHYAEKMAPDYSRVYKARAGWLVSQIPNSWENGTKAVSSWVQGVWLSFSNPEEALPQFASLGLGILSAFLLTFAVFALFLFLRYHSFFAHHLKHLVPLELSSISLLVLSLLFLFSPFFLGFGWMWVMALWVLVFWAYGGRANRAVTVVLLLLLLLLPTGLRFYSSLFLSLTGHGVPEILQANRGAWNEELYARLLAMNQADPEDRQVLSAIGLVEKRMGRFQGAEGRFLRVVQLDPRSGPAFNNLGNIYLVTHRPDLAMEAYRKAIRLEPSRSEAYYNLGQAYLFKLRMKEAEGEFQTAKALQPRLISYYTRISSRNPNRLLIDRTIDPLQVWRRILTITPEGERLAGSLWGILWGGVPLKYGEGAMGALLILLGVAHLISRRLSFIRNCDRCGKLICSRCSRSRVMGTQCVQCLSAFTANPSADLKVVKKKRAEVAQYQSRLKSLPQRVSRLLPGWGHLICGYSKEGILYLFILILFLTQVFLGVVPFPNPLALHPTLSVPWLTFLVVLFLLFYSLVQYRMRKIRLQGGKSHFRRA